MTTTDTTTTAKTPSIPDCDALIVGLAEMVDVYSDRFRRADSTRAKSDNSKTKDALKAELDLLGDRIESVEKAILSLPARGVKAFAIHARIAFSSTIDTEAQTAFTHLLEHLEGQAGISQNELGAQYWTGYARKRFSETEEAAA